MFAYRRDISSSQISFVPFLYFLTALVAHYAPIKSKLQHPPPPPGKPRAFDYFLCPGVGNLTGKAFPGVGNLTLPGWGGEN